MSETQTQEQASLQSGSVGLEVPGEPGVYWCAKHRKTQTRLRCGRCETPICPKCTVYGPTGARCRDCASYRGTHLYQVKPQQVLITFVASLVLGFFGALILQFTGLYLLLLFAPALGGVLGPLLTRLTGGKRGPKVAVSASAGMAIGVAGVILIEFLPLIRSASGAGALGVSLATGVVPLLIFLVLAVAGVWYWLK